MCAQAPPKSLGFGAVRPHGSLHTLSLSCVQVVWLGKHDSAAAAAAEHDAELLRRAGRQGVKPGLLNFPPQGHPPSALPAQQPFQQSPRPQEPQQQQQQQQQQQRSSVSGLFSSLRSKAAALAAAAAVQAFTADGSGAATAATGSMSGKGSCATSCDAAGVASLTDGDAQRTAHTAATAAVPPSGVEWLPGQGVWQAYVVDAATDEVWCCSLHASRHAVLRVCGICCFCCSWLLHRAIPQAQRMCGLLPRHPCCGAATRAQAGCVAGPARHQGCCNQGAQV